MSNFTVVLYGLPFISDHEKTFNHPEGLAIAELLSKMYEVYFRSQRNISSSRANPSGSASSPLPSTTNLSSKSQNPLQPVPAVRKLDVNAKVFIPSFLPSPPRPQTGSAPPFQSGNTALPDRPSIVAQAQAFPRPSPTSSSRSSSLSSASTSDAEITHDMHRVQIEALPFFHRSYSSPQSSTISPIEEATIRSSPSTPDDDGQGLASSSSARFYKNTFGTGHQIADVDDELTDDMVTSNYLQEMRLRAIYFSDEAQRGMRGLRGEDHIIDIAHLSKAIDKTIASHKKSDNVDKEGKIMKCFRVIDERDNKKEKKIDLVQRDVLVVVIRPIPGKYMVITAYYQSKNVYQRLSRIKDILFENHFNSMAVVDARSKQKSKKIERTNIQRCVS